MRIKATFFFYFFLLFALGGYSQTDTSQTEIDSTFHKVDLSQSDAQTLQRLDPTQKTWIKRNPYKALVAPAILVGLGAVLIRNPVYDRFDFKTDLFNLFSGFRGTKIDDYLIYSGYVELVGLNLLQIKCENDFINTSLIVGKSLVVNTILTFGLKYITNIERPNGARWAWPSGHTSQAFLAAAIVNREYRFKSPWPGIAAYTLAGTVGLFRMLNNKHWVSDVVAGAGIGILSANLTYITHKWRWGRPGTCMVPTFMNGSPGLVLVHRF